MGDLNDIHAQGTHLPAPTLGILLCEAPAPHVAANGLYVQGADQNGLAAYYFGDYVIANLNGQNYALYHKDAVIPDGDSEIWLLGPDGTGPVSAGLLGHPYPVVRGVDSQGRTLPAPLQLPALSTQSIGAIARSGTAHLKAKPVRTFGASAALPSAAPRRVDAAPAPLHLPLSEVHTLAMLHATGDPFWLPSPDLPPPPGIYHVLIGDTDPTGHLELISYSNSVDGPVTLIWMPEYWNNILLENLRLPHDPRFLQISCIDSSGSNNDANTNAMILAPLDIPDGQDSVDLRHAWIETDGLSGDYAYHYLAVRYLDETDTPQIAISDKYLRYDGGGEQAPNHWHYANYPVWRSLSAQMEKTGDDIPAETVLSRAVACGIHVDYKGYYPWRLAFIRKLIVHSPPVPDPLPASIGTWHIIGSSDPRAVLDVEASIKTYDLVDAPCIIRWNESAQWLDTGTEVSNFLSISGTLLPSFSAYSYSVFLTARFSHFFSLSTVDLTAGSVSTEGIGGSPQSYNHRVVIRYLDATDVEQRAMSEQVVASTDPETGLPAPASFALNTMTWKAPDAYGRPVGTVLDPALVLTNAVAIGLYVYAYQPYQEPIAHIKGFTLTLP